MSRLPVDLVALGALSGVAQTAGARVEDAPLGVAQRPAHLARYPRRVIAHGRSLISGSGHLLQSLAQRGHALISSSGRCFFNQAITERAKSSRRKVTGVRRASDFP